VRTELWAECGRGGSHGMPVPEIQAFDGRRQFIVSPGEIRPGDWLRDLGALRQVVSVEDLPAVGGSGRLFVVRFASAPGIEDRVLKVPDTVTVTIWRSA
jgi:hypothetical protein